MTTIDAALVREQGVTFAVVVVRSHILANPTERDTLARRFAPIVGTPNVVLMTQDHTGTPTYWGRPDIVRYLANTPLHALPWKRYHLN